MNSKILISKIFFIVATVTSANSLAKDLQPPPPPQEAKPIRYANATVIMSKQITTEDPNTGMINFDRETICKKTASVPVYGESTNVFSIVNASTTECETEMDGKIEKISSSAYINYRSFKLYKEAAKENFKAASITQWLGTFTSPADLEVLPSRSMVTRDLSQKGFILGSANGGGAFCKPSPNGSKCDIAKPVSFEVVWDIQDTQ